MTGAQAKARDSRRKADLNAVSKALELAKSDCQGSAYYVYPTVAGTLAANYVFLTTYLSDNNLKYMNAVPVDPVNTGANTYGFGGSTPTANVCPNTTGAANSQNGSASFLLTAQLEKTSDPDSQTSYNRCLGKPGLPPAPASGYYVCNQ